MSTLHHTIFRGYQHLRTGLLVSLLACTLPGCAVVVAADVAASIAIGTVGLAADAVIGTARIAGSAVGAAADAVLPNTKKETPKAPETPEN